MNQIKFNFKTKMRCLFKFSSYKGTVLLNLVLIVQFVRKCLVTISDDSTVLEIN